MTTLKEIEAKFPEWTRQTQLESWLSELRKEAGPDIMDSLVNECFNSTESEMSEDGSVWISGPQTGHWANDTEIESLSAFIEAQGQ